jgi:protein SCO1/2
MRLPLLAVALILSGGAISQAEPNRALPAALKDIGFDQHLDQQVPAELEFVDDHGRPVRMGDYFQQGPIVLVPAYYRCPMLCNQVLNGLTHALRETPFTVGAELQVVIVSIDPAETPSLAAEKKKAYLRLYQKPESADGWHFLTGRPEAIRRLTDSIGFRYAWDERTGQFAHAAGIVILTPSGRIARYFYDVRYPGRDMRLGLVEASHNKIGSPIDQVLLFCFHYDPSAGRYGAAITNLVRVGGVLTVIGLASFIGFLRRRESIRKVREPAASPLESSTIV